TWAQEWTNIYPLVEPYKGLANLDVSKALEAQKYGPVQMVKTGERFFTSLGLDPLPKTFWERSMLTKPRDREVVCHASAWDVSMNDDLRVKMCIRPTEEDLVTIHHELGHDYYFHAYYKLPALYQQGANDDFDPGAKYHIPANVPYTRYFLARLLQFQFHRALCRIAGHRGPLHACSIHGSKAAGARFEAMLALGASRPWPDALAALTGERR